LETEKLYQNKELILACKEGNTNAQYRIYNLYAKAMYNVSLRMVSSKEDAEDIVQESFLSAFSNINQFAFESTFGAWLKRIVINNSLNFLKKKKINLTLIGNEQMEVIDEDVEIDYEIDLNRIKKGIQLLPDGYKQIIVLYLIEGYDHNEIGEILNIAAGTSKSQYHRAKKKLLEIIQTN